MRNWRSISTSFSIIKLVILFSILIEKLPTHDIDNIMLLLFALWTLTFGDIIVKIYKV